VVLRERVREGKSAVGRVLLDVPGYTYRIFVTNRSESAVIIWRDYNGRACIEQHIEKLKNDLSAGGFCVREFFGTESAFLAVLFAFNLRSLYQRQITPEKPYRQPATLSTEAYIAGAVLGLIGKQIAIKLSSAWDGLAKYKPPPRFRLVVDASDSAEVGLSADHWLLRRPHSMIHPTPLCNHPATSAFG